MEKKERIRKIMYVSREMLTLFGFFLLLILYNFHVSCNVNNQASCITAKLNYNSLHNFFSNIPSDSSILIHIVPSNKPVEYIADQSSGISDNISFHDFVSVIITRANGTVEYLP